MKKLLLILTLISSFAYSQFCPDLGPNQILPCGVSSTVLTANLSMCGPGGPGPKQTTDYSVAPITYSPQTNTGTQLFMTDDSQQGPFSIGFNFCFYGQTYSQFIIGSNGWIAFSSPQSTAFTANSIPSAAMAVPRNCIMGPWQDWHPGIGGQIRYQMSGVAPCRKLTVSWIGIPMFQCTGNLGTFHIVIYESTNVIENYIQDKPACLSWQSGTAVQGVHNVTGTAAVTVPGRNSTAWTANNDAWRYTPNGPTVVPVLTWFQIGNPIAIGTGPTITVNPPPTGANYTCRFVYPICNAGWNSCNAIAGPGPDTVFVLPGPPNLPNPVVASTNPLCNYTCDGSISITPVGGSGVQTISWNTLVGLNPTGLCAGTYTYTLVDAIGCSVSGSVILNSPPIVTTGPINASDTVCYGSSSESYQVPLQPGYTYSWSSVGSILSGQGTDSINVDWSGVSSGFVPGGVMVTAYNANGCYSLPVTFDINVFRVLPTIQPVSPLCEYDTIFNLIGSPVGGVFSGTGITASLFDPSISVGINTITYLYTQSGCSFDTTTTITVYPRPLIDLLAPDNQFFEICEYDSTTITYAALTNPFGYNEWTFGGQTTQQGTFTITWNTPGNYELSVVHYENGCVSLPQQTNIIVEACPQTLYYIPNAFTPNGDELNNTWIPVFTNGYDPYEFNVKVYNRWGELIWESNSANEGWDGTYKNSICSEGIYQYIIIFGDSENESKHIIQGHITIMQ
jgi:gliding motility-associated-like protein